MCVGAFARSLPFSLKFDLSQTYFYLKDLLKLMYNKCGFSNKIELKTNIWIAIYSSLTSCIVDLTYSCCSFNRCMVYSRSHGGRWYWKYTVNLIHWAAPQNHMKKNIIHIRLYGIIRISKSSYYQFILISVWSPPPLVSLYLNYREIRNLTFLNHSELNMHDLCPVKSCN